MGTTWKNDDGLVVQFGTRDAENKRPGYVSQGSPVEELIVEFSYDDLPSPVDGDSGIGSIPAGSYLEDATLQVGTAWAGGTTIDIGFQQQDATEIDNDGIDAAVATAALTANAVIACDGADVDTVISADYDAYVDVAATGTYTAGTARLILRYIPPIS